MSQHFADYIDLWRHNGFWLFDHPQIIIEICLEKSINLSELRFLYLESELRQYDPAQKKWIDCAPDLPFPTNVESVVGTERLGYDVVTVSCVNMP